MLRGVVSAAAVALAVVTVTVAQDMRYATRLSTVPIDSRTAASVIGTGRVDAVLDGRTLSVDGSFDGLAGPASAAHLHLSPVTGVRGPSFAELDADAAPAGRVGGRVSLSEAQVRALAEGRIYVQIDSEIAPDGNLWGWLLQ